MKIIILILIFGLFSFAEAKAASAPNPEIAGNTSTYTFTAEQNYEFKDYKGFYFNSGVFPTVHMGVACQGSLDPLCRERAFADGKCILKTSPLFSSTRARINIQMLSTITALRRGVDEDDVAWSRVAEIRFIGRYSDGNTLIKRNQIFIKDLNFHTIVESLEDGKKLMRFDSFGVKKMPLPELEDFIVEGEMPEFYLEVCGIQATLFGLKELKVTITNLD